MVVNAIEQGYYKIGRGHRDAPPLKGRTPQRRNYLDHGQLLAPLVIYRLEILLKNYGIA